MKETKPKTLIVRISKELHDKLWKIAKKRKQKVSKVVREILENYSPSQAKQKLEQ